MNHTNNPTINCINNATTNCNDGTNELLRIIGSVNMAPFTRSSKATKSVPSCRFDCHDFETKVSQ